MHARELVVCTQAVPGGRRAGLSDGACMDVFSIGFTPAARDTGADASRAFVLSVGAAAACSFAFEAEAVEVRVVCVRARVFLSVVPFLAVRRSHRVAYAPVLARTRSLSMLTRPQLVAVYQYYWNICRVTNRPTETSRCWRGK